MAKTRRSRRSLSDAERAAKRAAERELMSAAIEQLRSSEGWQRWLAVRRHFHRYSLHNQFLIAHQRPGATRVAGFRQWLKLGYAVQKGERGISIWAPCPPSKRKLREWKEAGADPDERPRTRFRLVSVFDRSQVAPLPEFPGGPAVLDPPGHPIEGEGLGYLFGALCEFGASIGSRVRAERILGEAKGYYEPRSRDIAVEVVGEGFSPNAQVATTVHELSQALVRCDRREEDPTLTYREEEVVVESVVFWRDHSFRGSVAGRNVGDGCHRRRWGGARPARSASPRVARLRRAFGVAEGPRGAGPDRGGDDDGCQEETDRCRA